MKILKLNKLIFIVAIFCLSNALVNALTIEKKFLKLDLNENNGRFKLFSKNPSNEYISLFSSIDSRTSTFSIYHNNVFYDLGETFRFKKTFIAMENGGIFSWSSKELFIEQLFFLNIDNETLEISLSITNISETSKITGLKFLLDTTFEDENHFNLQYADNSVSVDNEYEISNIEKLLFWTSGVGNQKGVALKSIVFKPLPSKLVFGNWELLQKADYYYRTVDGRTYNNPPYSINDSAVLHLYGPQELQPQKSLKYKIVLKSIDSIDKKETKKNEQPETVEPETVEPETVEPETVEPETVEPETVEPETVEPETVEPETVEPETVEPETVEPETVEPETVEPETVEPETVEPETVEPETVEPVVVNNEIFKKELETVSAIQDIINSILISEKNITDDELKKLEELITRLEEIRKNENQ